MNLDYFFTDDTGSPAISVTQPLPYSFLIRNALTEDEIVETYYHLQQLPWIIQKVAVAGKYYLPKRETLGFADVISQDLIENRSFFGIIYPDFFRTLRNRVQQIIVDNISELDQLPVMNYCWGNRYRTGLDKVGKHKDREKGHSRIDPIVSVSFGTPRHFDVFDDYSRIDRFGLGFGDIFLMMPGFQQAYYHAVPTQRKIQDTRINLTFRTIESKIEL